MSREALQARVAAVLERVGCTSGESVLAKALLDAWSDDARTYHGTTHLEACLDTFEHLEAVADHPAEVAAALVFHDAVYDPRALDNEKESAAWARSALVAHGAGADVAERVARLVLATAHAERELEGDAALVVDVDLAILGASAEVFDAYETAVREEYAWVDEAQFRMARAAMLRRFLERPYIYQTDAVRARLEERARGNLARSLEGLEEERG